MKEQKMLRFTWRSNFWTLAAIFVIFLIGLQTVQPKKITLDSDIVFEEGPLESEGLNSHHKRSIDEFDGDEDWLWSNVNRIKRSIGKALGNEENETPLKNRAKRGFFDWWDSGSSSDGKESTTTTESTDHHEQGDDSSNIEEDEDSTTDDENDTYDGSGYTKIEQTHTETILLEQFFRLKFKVSQIWSPDYEASNTQAYKTKAKEIEKKLEHLYELRKPVKSRNHIRTHVIRILRPSRKEIFKIGVTVEIISDEPIALNELEQIIGPALDSRKIEDLSVERDSYYELTAIGESDLKRDNEIELVTGTAESDGNVSYEDDGERGEKDSRNRNKDEAENEALDYNESTDNNNDIDTDIPSSSSSPYPLNQCRADDVVECPNNPHFKICEVHFCDGVPQCPEGEDEDPERCRSECNDDEFACDSSRCILKSQLCNGVHDCSDLTDEQNCPSKTQNQHREECSDDQFACGDGKCIELVFRCDGNSDCTGGEDEICQCDENKDQFQCGDGTCVPKEVKCDGIPNCSNGEDEDYCEKTFACENNVTIPYKKKCNGFYDCRLIKPKDPTDLSDEKNCPNACTKDKFKCNNGICIEAKRRCNGIVDCNDNSDELNCAPGNIEDPSCDQSEFACLDESNQCIDRSAVCDGHRDCQNFKDEDASICDCAPYQFKCLTGGGCVDILKKCDGFFDCIDNSDESQIVCVQHNSSNNDKTCKTGEIKCISDNTCIESYKFCNGVPDCIDSSDEYLCQGTDDNELCLGSEFQCDQTKCILSSQVCDSVIDCLDASDEKDCDNIHEVPCAEYEFTCSSGLCIANEGRCDGVKDCLDGSDELACPSCQPGAFQCHNSDCILESSRCDRIHDCMDLSDEIHCEYSCNAQEFRCGDGLCVERQHLCDGVYQCNDRSDELHCNDSDVDSDNKIIATTSSNNIPCGDGEWQCDNGNCINEEFRCDGTMDCIDNSDEAPSNCPDVTPVPECRPDEISCDNKCHPRSILCNGNNECADGRDEDAANCPIERTTTTTSQPPHPTRCPEYTCPNGGCFGVADRCNRRCECSDCYDESGCQVLPEECRDDEFKCGDEDVCLPNTKKCDRVRDCRDGSDEIDCSCRPGQWQCHTSGECIDAREYCDGQYNCKDYSDEGFCHICGEDEFTCANGECIRQQLTCNGRFDCQDGSDESADLCKSCRPGQWQCHDGTCIDAREYCDGRYNCKDYSDERFCTSKPQQLPQPSSGINHRLELKTYPNNQTIKESLEVVFQCRDEGVLRVPVRWTRPGGRPLPLGSKDQQGRLEIPNIRLEHSGEYICEAVGVPSSTPGAQVGVHLQVERRNVDWERPRTACSPNEATCMNGQCIPKHVLCNGYKDCADGSDESSCTANGRCQPNEFKCNNNKCVLKTWRCDGENDCEDGSDEQDCNGTVAPGSRCSGSEYECHSGQCIPKSFECDSHRDCIDGSDEIGCTKPTVAQPPPPSVYLQPGDTFNITCRAVGVPTPLVLWRLNWGHIPEKCTTTSHNGYGVLTCSNIGVEDSGAYSCELLNNQGTEFVVPDTILSVSGEESVCQNGFFNDKATRPDECINCFCFGVSTQCKSADLFTYALPPPVTSLTVVGVHGPWTGQRSITIGEFDKHDLLATRHGVQLRLANLPVSGELPYYSLPRDYLGNDLKSYGGSFRYEVEYSGQGRPNDAPDVIVMGNGNNLIYRNPNRIEEGIRNSVSVSFLPGQWYNMDGRLVSREDIMVTLANVENILIRLQYIDTVQREVELLHIVMDSSGVIDRGLGSASLVEECKCPAGYSGLSCETCAPGYTRQESGAWLGRCIRDEEPCRPGTYGDPYRKIPCKPCPCPSTNGANNFAQTCYLGTDNEPVCDCNRGYTGRRCEQCAQGFVGNPLLPGGSCSVEQPVSHCDPRGTLRQHPDGRCECKEHVTGSRCDQCSSHSFFLNPKWSTGCIQCFCNGVSQTCTSSSLYRDSVRATFAQNRHEFTLITDYENPQESDLDITTYNNEVSVHDLAGDTDIYFWRLPSHFAGNKITSYGGNLNYSIRYKPTPGGSMSRNNAPDVVIRSANDITILHHRRDEVAPSSLQSYAVPILEDSWQRVDGITINREQLLMTLADVSDIFIKATYTTTTDEAALSQVILDTASQHYTGNNVRASEVEQCSCPLGHQGSSCEDCAPGYKRSQGGLYLGLCEPCDCNGHSDECDVETGVCHNCRDNTEGDRCERCANGYNGDATRGTQYDCSTDESHGSQAACPPNVVGHRCDQCRQGTYNYDQANPLGCTECFCSGVTRTCSASRFYRQQIPAIIFEDKFPLTNRIGEVQTNEDPAIDFATNKLSNRIYDGNTYYWSLPQRFLGNQLKSYGGYLSFGIENEAYGTYIPDQDIIIRGNGITLVWTRFNPNENRTEALFKESDWQSIDEGGPKVASRADLLTVLSNLEAILVRATLKEGISLVSLSDVALDTAVQQNTGQDLVKDIEICRCPEGYTGSSCESCDHFYYRDSNDRSAGLLGTCNRCPCENADSCTLESNGNVLCHCHPGYVGDRCTEYEVAVSTESPAPPTISVVISSPVIQIIDVGETVRLPCTAYHNIRRIPITVVWHKEDGSLPGRSYQENGVLTITNVQHTDSGVYVCQAQSEEHYEQRVTITVGGGRAGKPRVELRPTHLDVDEYSPADVECLATSPSPVTYHWSRLDGELSPDAYINGQWLRFNQVRRSDSGDYQCIASNQYGDDTSVLHVYVRESNQTPLPQPQPSHEVEIRPPNFNGRPGDNLVLNCRNVINVYATLVWNKSGLTQLPSHVIVRNGILTIPSVSVEDSGRYICTSSPSTSGQPIESITEVADVFIIDDDNSDTQVSPQPVYVKPLEELYTVLQSSDFNLACEASGNPYPTITWKKIHEDSLGSNVQQIGNTLKIFNAQPENRGIYQCIASNGQTADSSTVIDIEPREAPVVEIYPREPQTVRIGESAMLSCRAIAGIPTPNVIWSRSDRAPLSQRVEEKYAGTILISNITFEDAGQYECRASNLVGTASQTSAINVQQAPIIRIIPEIQEWTITEGDELKLECSAEGSPPATVQWKRPDRNGVEQFIPRVLSAFSVTPQSLIQKYNADRNDEGTYICHAVNEAGEDQKYITVFVQPKRGDVGPHDKDEVIDSRPIQPDRPTHSPYYPNSPNYPQPNYPPSGHRPDFSIPDRRPDNQPQQYKVAVGDQTKISCEIENINKRTSWRRQGGLPLPSSSHSSGGDLIIEYTQQDAAGIYECVVHEPHATYPIVTTELIVVELPKIVLQPEMPLTVRSGEQVYILCNATGDGPIHVEWHSEDHRPLPSNVRIVGNYLEFFQITPKNAGRYYCSATNPNGNVTKAAEVIVSHNEIPREREVQGRVQEVLEGESVSLECTAPSSPAARFEWRRENGELPQNAQLDRSRLILVNIHNEDTGRYICEKTEPNGYVTQNYLDVVLKPRYTDIVVPGAEYCGPRQFSCKSDPSVCIDIVSVCDGTVDCSDSSDELDCSPYLRNRSKKDDMAANRPAKFIASQPSYNSVAPYVKLEPARSFLHPGDSIVVDCKSSSPDSTVTWKREGYQRLPSNFRQHGIQLIISNAQSADAGRYICVCKTSNGQLFESEYELNVEIPPARNEIKPAQIEHAEAGSNIVLNCNPGRFANKYHWSRQQGHFAAGTDITSSDLRLDNVQAKDAGTYICTASSGPQSSEIPITLVVTGAIPYFPQAPKSYLVFPKLENSYMRFNFEVTFNPEKENGLILYNAQRHGEGHYISLSLNHGYPEFRFDFGSGPVIVRADKPIVLKQWHTVKVNKVRKEGYLLVDDQHPVAFPQTSRSGVELLENLYLGGVPNFNDIASSAVASHEGYVGCISRLILKDHEIELNKEAILSEGTTSCETCANDVCKNDGVCLETQTDEGFTCVCKSGYTGKTCAVEGLSCSPGICGTGRCENTDIGIECFCPLNKTGDRCQYTEHLDENNLSFKDGSFVSFKTPKSTKLNIRFNVRPETNQDSVLLYVAESEHANGDFAALVIKDKHYEFRFNTGGRVLPVIIRSEEEVDVDKWTSISLGRRHGEGFLKVGDSPQVTGKAIGPAHTMYLKTNLYIGGYDKRILLNKGVEVNRGFDGCISGLEVSSQKIDMIKSLLDGANIHNCGDTNEIAPEEPLVPAVCKPGYSGYNCEIVVDACLAHDPCENNGICESKDNTYVCNCPIHFTGEVCQHSAPIEFSSQYKGNGYIELNSSALVKGSTEKDILLAVLFSTTESNGLLVWYGQNKGVAYDGQDFIALAVVDGFLEFALRLDGEETSVKNDNTRVDDGSRHIAVLQRNGNRATLELDNFSVHGETVKTSRNYTYLPGNIFIGGAPEINKFTGERYRQGFNGCINIVEGTDTQAVNIYQNAVSGYNVTPCADQEDEHHESQLLHR
ncbi:basement membrane-specific heparan sulfate proteoglycan core protein isoform X6 [Contarinia nasturtii]|uniref:basement membrane-specific heparan sulfate proteoglycan core protein isoform X6 n=1 Tax=Contarinia nasturtii TaxID=265458 RepID=UPI0012D3CEFA|nr:basement membrane-specific heparan sulfate proteoglycan core protein isoform X6 [Contarinia nasturtii]